jgi:phosphoribosyl 1,2-cyclic phosphodiesterase
MIRFTVLGSGSSGNAVLICSETTRVLVDVGMSARETNRRLIEVGEDPASLDAILITHEHSDHAGGLRVFLSGVDCPVFISDATQDSYLSTKRGASNTESEAIKRANAIKDRTEKIVSNQEFRIGDIDFEPFTVPHDAADNFGFIAKREGVRVATLMDFGHFTDLISEKLQGCDAIVVESNHSIDMLKACSVYSWDLKQRIMSQHGHLSNEQLSDWLVKDFDGTARHIVLSHLSQKANEPNLAKLMAESALDMRPEFKKAETDISLSFRGEPTPWIKF